MNDAPPPPPPAPALSENPQPAPPAAPPVETVAPTPTASLVTASADDNFPTEAAMNLIESLIGAVGASPIAKVEDAGKALKDLFVIAKWLFGEFKSQQASH